MRWRGYVVVSWIKLPRTCAAARAGLATHSFVPRMLQ